MEEARSYVTEKKEDCHLGCTMCAWERKIMERVQMMIVEEINIAHSEGQRTSRLTSLSMRLRREFRH